MPPADLYGLKYRIQNWCRALNAELLKSITSCELLYRAECSIESNGYFEHFL